MYINQIDDLFDNIINKLYEYLIEKRFFKNIILTQILLNFKMI